MSLEERVKKLEGEMAAVRKLLENLAETTTVDPLEASHERFAAVCAEQDRRRLAGNGEG